MTSIKEVADALGVSSATVSRTMRGMPGVSVEVRARVREMATKLNYSASPNASSLATGRTLTIGVVTPYIARWYFAQLVANVESVLSEAGFDLLLYDIASDAARARFFQRMPVRKRVDAIISFLLPDDDEARSLRSVGVPLALVGARKEGFASFSIDDVSSAETAVRHLINLGHTRIGLIGGGGDPVPMQFVTPTDRRTGYLRALETSGIDYDPRLEENGEYTATGGERAMNSLLAASNRPTAVFAQSDEMAIGAMRAIRRHGLRVADDVSLIGFDNHEMAEMVGLTTVSQPLPLLGKVVATSVLEQLAHPGVEVPPHVELPTRLIVRETTGPLKP